MEVEGLASHDLTAAQAERYLAARRADGRVAWVSVHCLALPLAYLRGVGAAPAQVSAAVDSPLSDLLGAYRTYLINERGLVTGTVKAYLRIARAFCLPAAVGDGGMAQVGAADVRSFVVATCSQSSVALAKKTMTALASLLRYLYVVGVTAEPLGLVLPKVTGRRSGSPGWDLDSAAVTRLLAGCDRERAVGRRDFAVLTLLGRLGLRAGEVAALTLDDVDWHRGEVVIRGKGDRHERLPLPDDVGQAVAVYLRHARPPTPQGYRTLFLRVVAPVGPLSPTGISLVVSRAARRAGLDACGSHRLRHFAATATLRHGAPLPEVAELLRQRNLMVTARYAHVDPAALRELAVPWPGGAA
jgi:site-specific recombinase XerD